MKTLAIALLAILALLTGGCSIVFLVVSIVDPNPMETLSFVGIPVLMGLGVAGIAILLIRYIIRSTGQAAPEAEKDGEPPKGRW